MKSLLRRLPIVTGAGTEATLLTHVFAWAGVPPLAPLPAPLPQAPIYSRANPNNMPVEAAVDWTPGGEDYRIV